MKNHRSYIDYIRNLSRMQKKACKNSGLSGVRGHSTLELCISQFHLRPAPPPPPPSYCAAFARLVISRGHSQAFDTHAVSYQNITTQEVLLKKKADWLICKGQE